MALRRRRTAGTAGRQRPLRDPFREDAAARAPLLPILAALETDAGRRAPLALGTADGGRVERLAALVNRGLSRREACEALGI